MFRCSEHPAILLIHGFGGNRSEVRPLADHLRGLGCEVVSVLLPGHSDQRRGLQKEEARASLWLSEVRRRLSDLRRRHHRVIVIGFSMGGLLAIQAVSELNEDCGSEVALVTINAPVWFWNVPQMARNVMGEVKRHGLSGGAAEVRRYRRDAGGKPAVALVEFLKLLMGTGPQFAKVNCPTLVIQAADDDIVWPVSALRILRKLEGSRRLVVVPEGGHQILGSSASETVCREVEVFVWEKAS